MKGNLEKGRNLSVSALAFSLITLIIFSVFTFIKIGQHIDDRRYFGFIEGEFAKVENRLSTIKSSACVTFNTTCQESLEQYLAADFPSSVQQIQRWAGNEDSWFTKRHEEKLEQIVIALQALNARPNEVSWSVLRSKMRDMREIYVSLDQGLLSRSESLVDSLALGFLLLSLAAIFSLVLAVWFQRRMSEKIQLENHARWSQIQEVNQSLGQENALQSLTESVELDPAVQAIVMRFIAMQSALTESTQGIDLFRNINKSINYEFRTLTNTITGGLRLLTGEIEGKSLVLANEMMQSTVVLDDLANNFLGIFGDVTSDAESNVQDVIDRVLSLVRAKSERNYQQLECFVSRYVPDTLQVSPIKLLWSIYLELSKVIDVYRSKQVVIMIDSQREVNSVRQILSVKFYFVDSLGGVIQDLDEREWSDDKEVGYCYADLIFSGNVPATYSIAKDPQGDIRYTLSLTIRAASSQTKAVPLADNTYLLCGSSSLQNDIIDKTIRQAGGEVVYLPTPASAFQTVPKYPDAAGVIVTDTIEGIELKSFLRTLSSRMKSAKLKPKLILSLSSKQFEVETTDFVDQVVLRPTSPVSFVNALVSVLPESDEDGETEAEKIICVDDDMTHGFILSEILDAGGWPAEHHENSREAVDYITSHPVKIVFMDCIMPDLNGFEATRMIRAHEEENNVKQPITIIGATGLTSVSEMNDCIEAGMDYVINKPYSQDEILRVLKTYSAARKVV